MKERFDKLLLTIFLVMTALNYIFDAITFYQFTIVAVLILIADKLFEMSEKK